MMFDIDQILGELKGFQRDAVDHVMFQFYERQDPRRRYLVADETGLGKSVIARGVIARVIERLQTDKSVDRIDIVYVCSNSDLAQQNLKRLNVTGETQLAITSRLTLLARETHHLARARRDGRKVVNLVSFTPGTSFDLGWRTGNVEERALLHIILSEKLGFDEAQDGASRRLLQGNVSRPETFDYRITQMHRQLRGPVDKTISKRFIADARELGLISQYRRHVRRAVAGDIADKHTINPLTGALRAVLARASVETLEPDLVILDEFQRFRHLLDEEEGGEAAELAHNLFDFGQAKVLLLSATPYKPYTQANDEDGDDHYRDLMTTLGFLASGSVTSLSGVRENFAGYREAILAGRTGDLEAGRLREQLLGLMSRTERPQLAENEQVHENRHATRAPESAELASYVQLTRLAESLGVPIGIEYWKSIPHFAHFMESYVAHRALDERLSGRPDRALKTILKQLASLHPQQIEEYKPVDLGNAALRSVADEMLESGLWKLLWLPPSLPYLHPEGAFADPALARATKKLVFSSWTATPTAIASLISYEAERRIVEGSRLTENTADARKAVSSRLNWAMDGDRPGSMSTLALFWPHAGLAALGDPLKFARESGGPVSESMAVSRLSAAFPAHDAKAEQAWQAFFNAEGSIPPGGQLEEMAAAIEHRGDQAELQDDAAQDPRFSAGLRAHIVQAMSIATDAPSDHGALAALALNSPGNIAYRALARMRSTAPGVSDIGHWNAAAHLANGLRSLFARIESMILIDKLYPDGATYWQNVLRYCADGNLQATLDEYLFQLRSETAGAPVTDELLMSLASRAAEAITARPSRYQARHLSDRERRIPFSARFALRYGGKQQNQESERQPEIRNAFNSPFWPFMLASTSVGQEGIDFHWWCHSVLHWNVPSSPIDFEQREGRVNRFAGHAIRKNVAADHGAAALQFADPWSAAFEVAAHTYPELDDFSPYWVYPGDARIERQLLTYPMSKDIDRIDRLKQSLTLYRLTLGQPRQEDLLELLAKSGVDVARVAPLDLRPPRSTAR